MIRVDAERSVRHWLAAAAVFGQVAATAAGVLRPAFLPLAAIATVIAAVRRARPEGVWARCSAFLALAIGVGVVMRVAESSSATTSVGLSGMLSTLTLALVGLTVVMAPGWHRSRDYRLWLCIDAAVLVAAAAGITRTIDAVPLVAGWLVVIAAGGVLQAQTLSEAVDVHAMVAVPSDIAVPQRLRATRTAGLPVISASLVGALVYLAIPGGLGGGGLSTRVAHLVSPSSQPPLTRAMVGVDTTGSGFLDLRARGSLPTTPLLRVPSDSPALWRGAIYDKYDGAMWTPTNARGALLRGSDVTLPSTTVDPKPKGVRRTDVVAVEPAAGNSLVWSPGVVRRLRADMVGVWMSSSSTRIFGHANRSGYTVTSVVPTSNPVTLTASAGADETDPTWTALPAELPARVNALARRVTATARDRYARVQAVERYLRGHETYTLDSPVPGPGEDAVDRFLFRDHVGFCEQFASATTVMLRAVGVPARVVSGLAYGHPFGADERLFTAADAHAWVEVYYPSIGWVPTDPTAGVRLAPAAAPHRSGLLAWLRAVGRHVPAGSSGLVTLLLVATAGAVAGIVRLRRRFAGLRTAGRVLEAFHAFVHRSRRPRADAETAREYLERVAPDGALADALATLEQECYGETPPDPASADLAVTGFATSPARE